MDESAASSDCWIKDLDDFVQFEIQTAMPIEENAFKQYLYKFITETPIGRDHMRRRNLYFKEPLNQFNIDLQNMKVSIQMSQSEVNEGGLEKLK